MSIDLQSPATKQDIALLMESIGNFYARTEQQFAKIEERFAEIEERFEKIEERFAEIEERLEKIEERFAEMRLHFDFTVETIRNDLRDADRESIASLQSRVIHLERKAGIVR